MRALILILLIVLELGLHAADWQWAEDMPGGHGRALLWVPPHCKKIRGVIIGCQVILEKKMLDDPQIRAAAEQNDLAMVLAVDSPLSQFDYDPKGKDRADLALAEILNTLAERSGIKDLAQAPLFPVGHSGGGNLVWRMIYWNPSRMIGGVALHAAPTMELDYDPKAKPEGVPVLDISGQWEAWGADSLLDRHWQWVRGAVIYLRSRMPEVLASELVQPGCGHFSWNDRLAASVADFIRKAAQRRLPKNPDDPLVTVTAKEGWLSDSELLSTRRHPPAPFDQYQGEPSMAFWHLDGDLARQMDDYSKDLADKRPQMLTFVENGKPLNPEWCIPLKNLRAEGDGITYRVQAQFINAMPTGTRDAGWPLGHAATSTIRYSLIGGWGGGGEQVGPDSFRVAYDQIGFKRNHGIFVLASQEGDERYAFTEIAGTIPTPKRTVGLPQKIDFPPVPDLRASSPGVVLAAKSDAGLPVSYAVLGGPVEIHDGHLTITAIPELATLPMKVTIAAWQLGLDGDHPVQSAEPVVRQFLITQP